MAIEQRPDLKLLLATIARLKREANELSAQRRRLHDQIDNGHANDLTRARERKVSAERLALFAQIDELEAQLAWVRLQTPEPPEAD